MRLEKIVFIKVELWIVFLCLMLAGILFVFSLSLVADAVREPQGVGVAGDFLRKASYLPNKVVQLFRDGVEIDYRGLIVSQNPQIRDFSEYSGYDVIDESFHEDGYLLISAYSRAHAISTVYLYSLQNKNKLWEWVPDYAQILKSIPSLGGFSRRSGNQSECNRRDMFRSQHPYLMPDGSVIISSGDGVLLRMNLNGDILWVIDRCFHHSIQRMQDGNFVVPVVVKGDFNEYRDDGYAIITPDGDVLEERSVLGILVRNGFRGLVFGVGEWEEDCVHLNYAMPIKEDDEFVRKGDLVFSARNISTVFLYRPSEDKVVWLRTGPWVAQHSVHYEGNGVFSVFGNDYIRGKHKQDDGWIEFQNSNVYTYDMKSGLLEKPFAELFKSLSLRTETQGLQQLLPNGDVFVELTDANQLMRLSRSGMRWRYVSNLGQDLVGALHWCRYYSKDEMGLSWLKDRSNNGGRDVDL